MKLEKTPNIKVGDRITQYLHFGMGSGFEKPKLNGEVIWIHPKRRFYRVKFTLPNGSVITESYLFNGRYNGRNAYVGKE